MVNKSYLSDEQSLGWGYHLSIPHDANVHGATQQELDGQFRE
jgi:hypothetical protein